MFPIILDAKTKPFYLMKFKKNIKWIYAYHDYLKPLNKLYNNSFYPLNGANCKVPARNGFENFQP